MKGEKQGRGEREAQEERGEGESIKGELTNAREGQRVGNGSQGSKLYFNPCNHKNEVESQI